MRKTYQLAAGAVQKLPQSPILRNWFLLLLLNVLLHGTALAQSGGDDGWGEPVAPATPPAVEIRHGVSKTVKGSRAIHEVWVENVADQPMLLFNYKLEALKAPDSTTLLPVSSYQLAFHTAPIIKLLPGSRQTIITISTSAATEFHAPKYTYWYRPNERKEVAAGTPVSGADYAIYPVVDIKKKEASYYLYNFTAKPLQLEKVHKGAFSSSFVYWSGDGSSSPDYTTVYEGPDKAVTVAPGESVLVWKDRLLLPNVYQTQNLEATVRFGY